MKLEDHPFIQCISPERRTAITDEVDILNLAEGETIFAEQSPPDALFLILEGSVVFTKTKPDGSLQNVSSSGEGMFFGEVGVVTGEPRALGARSLTPAVIGRVPEATVRKTMQDAEPVKKVLESVISHLKSTTQHYMDEVMKREKLLLVGTMVSSILHDFKNPFSIISMGAHILNKRYGDDEHTAKICDNIEAQIRRMVEMAKDLSAYARGDEAIEVAFVSLDSLFTVFRELNGPFFENSKITLEMEANDVTFHGDGNKMLRVLQNLVSNAFEALEESGNGGSVKVTAQQEGDTVLLTVADDGPGIPEDIREDFFEPFVTYGKTEGTGLGSAIAKSVIDSHKGTICFETGPEGTCFTIRIPKDPSH